jgi:predicted phage terminase large subunit-like protein
LDYQAKIKENRQALSENIRLQLERELYKQSFYDFFQQAVKVLKPNDDWQFNFHHQYLCELLQTEAIRINNRKPKKQDYCINIPPATTKSRLVSVCYNAWVWACVNPALTFGCISNSEDLGIEFATDTKDLIESDWYQSLFPEVQLRADTSAKSNFKNTAGGARISVSILSKITGWHFNFLLIDDPHDSKDVSDILLEKTVRNYRETIFNRLKNPSIDLRLVIGQRVHENDLSGYILSNNASGKYKHICLPMELTDEVQPPELKQYYKNGVLWYDRFPVESFSDLTDSQTVFATQYLQRASPLAGGIIKKEWFELVESVPVGEYHLFIDSAYTSSKSNDATAITVAGVFSNIIYVKRVYELWLEFPELIKKIQEIVMQDTSLRCKVYIEPKASGKSIAQQLKRETMLNVIELPAPKDSKLIRVNSITPKLESKRVKLLKAGWNDNLIDQCAMFPNARRDDMLDTLVMAVDTLLSGSGKITWYM